MEYRQSVSAFILNENKQFLLVLENGVKPYWKLPSGGIEDFEDEVLALQREIKEELNIFIDILDKSSHIRKYDWPDYITNLDTRKKYIGQEKRVFVVKIKKNQKLQKNHEILDYKWVCKNTFEKYISVRKQLIFLKKVISEKKDFF
jgi:8-oxo-dGTP pyrophosphatase MutT (NUDIX family)